MDVLRVAVEDPQHHTPRRYPILTILSFRPEPQRSYLPFSKILFYTPGLIFYRHWWPVVDLKPGSNSVKQDSTLQFFSASSLLAPGDEALPRVTDLTLHGSFSQKSSALPHHRDTHAGILNHLHSTSPIFEGD
jgi:hypothetical protein